MQQLPTYFLILLQSFLLSLKFAVLKRPVAYKAAFLNSPAKGTIPTTFHSNNEASLLSAAGKAAEARKGGSGAGNDSGFGQSQSGKAASQDWGAAWRCCQGYIVRNINCHSGLKASSQTQLRPICAKNSEPTEAPPQSLPLEAEIQQTLALSRKTSLPVHPQTLSLGPYFPVTSLSSPLLRNDLLQSQNSPPKSNINSNKPATLTSTKPSSTQATQSSRALESTLLWCIVSCWLCWSRFWGNCGTWGKR